jgi:hypothetical protein
MGTANYIFNIYQNKCNFKLKLSLSIPKNETGAKEPNVKSVADGGIWQQDPRLFC